MTSPFLCSPVIRKCSRKKTQTEKQTHILCYLHLQFWPSRWSRIQKQSPKMFHEILQISQENTSVGVFFYNVASLQACSIIKKETPTQKFSCEIWEILKNNYFEEHLRMTASVQWFMTWCQSGTRTPGPGTSGLETPLKV